MFEGNRGDQAFQKERLLGTEGDLTFAGALSFMRRRYTRDLAGADVVVSGVPFDMATSGRPGARLGPRAIRAGSVGLAELRSYPHGFDPFETLAVIDWGDVFFDYGYPAEIVEVLHQHAKSILDSGSSMLTFGGDHFITYPLLKAHAEKHGPVSLIHFDAHVDTWDDDGGRLDHGSMFKRALDEGIVDSSTSVQIGIRTYNTDDFGFTILGAPWVHRYGPEAVLEVVGEVVPNDKPAYITFDIDCLDPSYAPGTGTPVAGGLTTAQALAIVRGLGQLNLIGMDVVEVAPAYDNAEITAIAGATLAYDYLCLQAIRHGAKPSEFGRQAPP